MNPSDYPQPAPRPNLPGAFADHNSGAADTSDKDVVEEASWESFPASDAPSWTPVTAVGAPAAALHDDECS